jgi:hypothetical protein
MMADKFPRLKHRNFFEMKYHLSISSILAATIAGSSLPMMAQSPTATLKGTTIYPADFLPAQQVCAQNTQTQRTFCVETKQGQRQFSLRVNAGSYEIYARECQKTYRQATTCRDGYRLRRAYYNQFSKCGITAECERKFKKNRPIVVQIAAGSSITDIKPHDWYTR